MKISRRSCSAPPRFAAREFDGVRRRAGHDARRTRVDRREGRDHPPDSHRVGAGRPDQDRQRRTHRRRTDVDRSCIDVPEAQALDVLLRSRERLLAAPRAGCRRQPLASSIASSSCRSRLAARAPVTAVAAQPPAFQQPPQFNRMPQPADDDDDRATPNGVADAEPDRGPVFNTFPQPQAVNPQRRNGRAGVRRRDAQPAPQPAPSRVSDRAVWRRRGPGHGRAAAASSPGQQPGQPVQPRHDRPGGR